MLHQVALATTDDHLQTNRDLKNLSATTPHQHKCSSAGDDHSMISATQSFIPPG